MKYGSVVVADSNPYMLEGIRDLLETLFESLVMVADETSLIQTIEKLKPDLVVVDLSLKTTHEVNVASLINNRYPELKFIILSVHDDQTLIKKVMDFGASGFVLKRSAVTDLIPAVEEVIQGRTYISPASRL